MNKKFTLLLCALFLISTFSAWVFVPPFRRAVEQEKYKQIAICAINEKYGIDISAFEPTYAIKDNQGNITGWRELSDDVSVYIYGLEPCSYFVFYSVALQRVVACEIDYANPAKE